MLEDDCVGVFVVRHIAPKSQVLVKVASVDKTATEPNLEDVAIHEGFA